MKQFLLDFKINHTQQHWYKNFCSLQKPLLNPFAVQTLLQPFPVHGPMQWRFAFTILVAASATAPPVSRNHHKIIMKFHHKNYIKLHMDLCMWFSFIQEKNKIKLEILNKYYLHTHYMVDTKLEKWKYCFY